MLRWMFAIVPAFALAVRFGAPPLSAWLLGEHGFDLVPYYPLITSVMGMIGAALVGTVIGFLLLDQKDDGTLPALLVTPMSLGDYLGYRLAVPSVLAAGLAALGYPLCGLVPLHPQQVILSALTAAPLAAIYALGLGAFAANKVQGFALVKGIGVVFAPAVFAWFLPWPWQELIGIIPHYWSLKVFWAAGAGQVGSAWGHAVVGIAYQALLIAWLTRRLARATRR